MHTLYLLFFHNKHNLIIELIKLKFLPNNQYMKSFICITLFCKFKKECASSHL